MEQPCLPVFGRHFKNCTSKISGEVEEVMRKIFRILKEYFPQNIAFWTDCDEDGQYELFESGVYKLDPNALVSKEFFYERVKKVFAKDFTDENDIHKARKTFARRWLFL